MFLLSDVFYHSMSVLAVENIAKKANLKKRKNGPNNTKLNNMGYFSNLLKHCESFKGNLYNGSNLSSRDFYLVTWRECATNGRTKYPRVLSRQIHLPIIQ